MPATEPIRLFFPDDRGYDVAFEPLTSVATSMRRRGLEPGRCFVITDRNVAGLHLDPLVGSLVTEGYEPAVHVLPPGESAKTLDVLFGIYDWALSGSPPQRDTPLLALGGGAVGDVAGFAAATLLRGVPLVHMPTTLLAQVDSAIGGKTAVNHAAGKNVIGTVYQPRLVVADAGVLATLSDREWASGLAEIVKAALIADVGYFEWLEAHWPRIERFDPEVVAGLIRPAVEIKARVVMDDEREHDRRAILNFGHTFAHAIEKVTGYASYTHGEAVALGMRAALALSEALLPGADLSRARRLVERLPVQRPLDVPVDQLMHAMDSDKKRARGRPRFVVLRGIGTAEIAENPPPHLVEGAWLHATKPV